MPQRDEGQAGLALSDRNSTLSRNVATVREAKPWSTYTVATGDDKSGEDEVRMSYGFDSMCSPFFWNSLIANPSPYTTVPL